MSPFEDLIRDLGTVLDVPLKVDSHQSCRLAFTDDVAVQIDLDHQADRIVVGAELGALTPGTYREKVLQQAMRVNGLSREPRGILAYSEKKDALVLFQFLALADLNGEKLHHFLQLFHEHAKIWTESLARGEIPPIEEDRGG